MSQDIDERPSGSGFDIRHYGAAGDGRTADTWAIQSAIEACAQAGGGTVFVPAGAYVTGSIVLRSHVTLHIDAGATLLGSERASDYPVIDSRWEGIERQTHAPLIGGSGLTGIAITGRGTVHGRGACWWERHRAGTLEYPRPRLLSFTSCTNVLIRGVTLTNSPSWTVNPIRCDNVTVDGVTIANPARSPNTDGINPDSCRNVRISNCHIDVGDDCVTIKSGAEEQGPGARFPCENITVTNCTMVRGHGGLVIGSEMSGDVRNVVIANCVFQGTDRGIRLKSRRGRGGVVEDVRATNIVMEGVLCPFIMNLYYGPGASGQELAFDRSPHPLTGGTPRFRRLRFTGITARKVQYAAAFLYGLPEMPLEDVSFSDVSVSMAPEAQAGHPAMAPGMKSMQRAGFLACHVRGLRLHQVEVRDQAGPAFVLANAAGVEISASTTPTPPGDAAVILLRDVDGAFIHGCRACPGTHTFLQLEGQGCRGIALSGNHLCRAVERVVLADGARPDAVDG